MSQKKHQQLENIHRQLQNYDEHSYASIDATILQSFKDIFGNENQYYQQAKAISMGYIVTGAVEFMTGKSTHQDYQRYYAEKAKLYLNLIEQAKEYLSIVPLKYTNGGKVMPNLQERLSTDVLFLFITATELETEILHDKIKPLDNESNVLKHYIDNNTYYIGKIGLYNIVHVQCGSMGTMGRDSSITTVIEAINHWRPDGVVMVGIAFGIDLERQKIGDVLVSTCIVNYENVKITPDKVISRSSIPESGRCLVNRFRNMLSWSFYSDERTKATKHNGLIVTGEKLLDDKNARDRIIELYPSAIGGEMEGYGVYSACASSGIDEWIIVKGICDWADGNKSENKIENQTIAMKSALSLCSAVLSEENAFEVLKKKQN